MQLAELTQKLRVLLATDLGTFHNGQPAIWTTDDPQPPQPSGLRLLVGNIPGGIAGPIVSYQVFKPQLWKLSFTQFDPTIKTLQSAVIKVENNFLIQSLVPIPPNSQYQILAGCEITIYDPIIRNI